jgi:ubiquinone/menaquinone biosynthesis C-methylase UbiE
MNMSNLSSHAQEIYNSSRVVHSYKKVIKLLAPETVIFDELRVEFANKRILDIGVGAGRTVPHLTAISARYVGIDFAECMVEQCRARFPAFDFHVCSVTDMRHFSDGAFDLVVFSFNGLDTQEHEERLRALSEINRVLDKDGKFVFSSHNRNRAPIQKPWSLSRLPPLYDLKHPLSAVKRVAAYVLGTINYLRLVRRNEYTEGYEIIVDEGHNDYGMRGYHITPDKQIAQLKQAGFETTGIVNNAGHRLGDAERVTDTSPWIYYVCRKEARNSSIEM